jgi:hypothetical protein
MHEDEVAEGMKAVVEAIERSGRSYQIRNGELNLRCPVCGDSSKSLQSKHFYIKMDYPHPSMCQRCGFRSGELTVEVLESLGAAERDAGAYARAIGKDQRRSGRGRRRGGPRLGLGRERLAVPPPDRSDPQDAAALGYVERRLGLSLEDRECQRYKIVACGLFGFLAANGVSELTVHQREADRLNDTCVGFLSADESYVVFRTLDEEHVRRGGRRYTNYRVFKEWEGSKVFACRADVDLLSPTFTVVQAEGVLDLIGVERAYYAEERWRPDFVGVANNGSAHGSTLRMLIGLGIIGAAVELHIDNEQDSKGRTNIEKARMMVRHDSAFFRARSFRMRVWQNEFGPPAEKKDFGVPRSQMERRQVKL